MSIVLGIDIGGSTTKIVGFDGKELIGTLQVRASDQITSLYGAIGNFLRGNNLPLCEVSKITLTGVGASFISEDIYGIETVKVDEFLAIAHGGLYLSGLSEAYVVSLGTGTALVRAAKSGVTHIGGSGVGGGTLIGLCSKITGRSEFDAILKLAESGKAHNVDLSVRDILGGEVPSLPPDLTAANFGKIVSTASDADFAFGVINMVLQTAGMLAVFAAHNDTIRDIVLTGTLTTIPQINKTMTTLSKIHNLNFIIPDNAVFSTAIGAVTNY